MKTQSLFLEDLARQQNERGNRGDAILLALETLPKNMAQPDRPYLPEAEVQLYHAAMPSREWLLLEGTFRGVFSPDGKRILTTDGNSARVWDAKNGQELATLIGHTDMVTSAAFSPDGTRIVTASGDGTARVWDISTTLNTGSISVKEVATLTGHTDMVTSAAFSPDGTRIVTASNDGTARVWRGFRTTQELIDYANRIVPRRLTPEERKKYFLE